MQPSQTFETSFKTSVTTSSDIMPLIRRISINHAHPTKLLLDLIGMIWMVYFLWNHELWLGIGVGVACSILGTVLTMGADTDALRRTALGKYMLDRLIPMNLVLQVVGYIVALYGVWAHVGWIIFGGVSVVLLGHLWRTGRKVIP